MEIQTTEATENSAVLPVVSTEITETSEQSPPPVTNTQANENVERTTLPLEATSTHETAPLDVEMLDKSTLLPLGNTETTGPMEKSVMASDVVDNSHVNLIASPENPRNPRGRVMRQETAKEKEEVRGVLKVIAATGKFWYDWEKLRSTLSLHLMQVISEYPQAKMKTEEQKVSLGETYTELAKRLDDALHSFLDGPPFTLQRLSEIILDARIVYPNLSKLALALEKNLSVTSTLNISTDPYPSSLMTAPNGLNKVTEVSNPNPQQYDTVMENGAPPVAVAADRDEIMIEVEVDVGDVTTMDVEPAEKSSESSPMTADIVDGSRVLVQRTAVSKL